MSTRPWYPRYGADFVHGTMGLSLEEKGAYSLCLDLIYDRGGPIPDDARWLAGVCGVSVRKWGALRQRLLEVGKLVLRETGLSNVRAENELENSAKIARKHAENGAKGGNKRAENALASSENNDLAQAGLKHRARVPQPQLQEKEREDAAPPPDGGVAPPPQIEALPPPASFPTGGSSSGMARAAAGRIDDAVKRAAAEETLADPAASDEDRFFALRYRLEDAGVRWSRAMQLKGVFEDEGFRPIVSALEKALRARNPSTYLGAIVADRKKLLRQEAGEPEPPRRTTGSQAREPQFVREYREDGYDVAADGPNRWIIAGQIYDETGEVIGW
ncbi:MAG: hypothetical protein DI565_14000 [Ancylobacter novellus]|uniref:DUF1376 domain-containing protein n=1 Tax=Ancylobacter novellus TaxID=921 RepID=A0A2W5MJM3_ANCNO|nr:MAG: hypothetical protein DI565_14000 [Ancylobacter novellus]